MVTHMATTTPTTSTTHMDRPSHRWVRHRSARLTQHLAGVTRVSSCQQAQERKLWLQAMCSGVASLQWAGLWQCTAELCCSAPLAWVGQHRYQA
jgi:hypothetical protein